MPTLFYCERKIHFSKGNITDYFIFALRTYKKRCQLLYKRIYLI